MNISSINFNYKINQVALKQRNVRYSNLVSLPFDTISFGAMKKKEFSGIDLAVIQKFSAPIEKFNTNADLQNWAGDKAKAIANKDFGGRREETEIQTNGNREVSETIDIPSGTNTLNIYARDINGQEVRYEQNYTIQGDITIDLSIESDGLKITTQGKDQLSYMTYRWDEEEETRVDINNTSFEQTIEIPKGQHTLTVVVVDVNNKTETKEQEVKGVTKPTINISLDQENGELGFLVTVTDEEGLRRIEFTLNEEERYKQEFDDNTKEFSYKFPIKEGENKILVKAYNINDVTEEAGARFQN